MSKSAIVIGSGFSGLSAAAYLAKQGFRVKVFEKNSQFGGRARVFEEDGFKFDMGPSWYWMPEVFEKFYGDFGKTTSDFYNLKRLDPSYKVFFSDKDQINLPSKLEDIYKLFESYEEGAGEKLKEFLAAAEYRYDIGMNRMVPKPSLSPLEFVDWEVINGLFKMDLFNSFRSYTDKYFKHPFLKSIIEFPILFLGATAENTPALYSMMNHADMALGTWYPEGGMHEIIKAFVQICEEFGVEMHSSSPVTKINSSGDYADSVTVNDQEHYADLIIAGADYAHVDRELLAEDAKNYNEEYWDSRTMAPSCLLYYLGVNKKIDGLLHHNLFFDESLDEHAEEIYESPQWPSKPLFYVCNPSKTDSTVAPPGQENLFILIPVATGLANDNDSIRERYFDIVLNRIEKLTSQKIRDNIIYKRTYAHSDFIQDYNAFKGNAYGLANTLDQTAILKPSIKSKKLRNLYFTGQLTVPGPGIPPSIISGKIVAKQAAKEALCVH